MARNYLSSTLSNRCPRCREGKLFVKSNPYDFSNITTMNEHCPVCGQPTEIEVGFYYGTGFGVNPVIPVMMGNANTTYFSQTTSLLQ